MRSKIEGRIALKIVGLATIFFLSIFDGRSVAQTLPPEILSLAEQLSDDSSAQEELLSRYESLARRRPNLNRLTREELEASGLMTLFQIESIRKSYGDILSAAELAAVDGFTREKAALCAQFFSFGGGIPGGPSQDPVWRHTAWLRTRWKYADGAPSLTGKYAAVSSRLTVGATLDHDAGEPWQAGFLPDFISATAAWDGRREEALQRVVAGDFTARFGQGLVLWKAFNAGALLGEPGAVLHHGSGLKPYTSTDEHNFLRGAGVTAALGAWSLTGLFSYKPLDARIVADTAFTSIATDGLHRSGTERSKRHTMHETLVALALGRKFTHWRIGMTVAAYRYDKHNARPQREDNRYQKYDGWWGNLGVDAYWHSPRWRLFGEAALDAHGAPAVVAGTVWSSVYALETSLLLRHYDKAYIATHAGAYSTLSACANQAGATLSLRYYLNKHWTFRAHGECSYYPWSRYGHPGPSSAWRARVELAGTFADGSSAQLLFRNNSGKWQARLGGSLALSERWSFGARAQGGPGGGAAYAETTFTGLHHRLTVSGRITYYDIADWDSRVSFYEKSLPQSYGVRQFYGKGTGAYLLVKYAPVKSLEGWIRVSDDYCAFLIRSFIPG